MHYLTLDPFRISFCVFCGLLFDLAAKTLPSIAAHLRYLSAQAGVTMILYSWRSALMPHPYIHGIVLVGRLSSNEEGWVVGRPAFYLSVRVLSRLLVRGFRKDRRGSHESGQLEFAGEYTALADATVFADWLAPLRQPLRVSGLC